jgi:aminoglycoside phosphotransferase (APT) family kinase protein
VLTPPEGLSIESLAEALARHSGLEVASLAYRPVGFGSHHWELVDAVGSRWFVTADDLHNKRVSTRESLNTAFARLSHALAAAIDLRAYGRSFVVAPVAGADGEPLVRASAEFAIALYPFVRGKSFEWGEIAAHDHRQAILELLVAVHTAPRAARLRALHDDFAIPHRDELDSAVDPAWPGEPPEVGPYARPMTRLLEENKAPINRLLGRFDELAMRASAMPSRAVLTHGEPHSGNTMLTADGWRLIDWDTTLIAAPERDLWILDPGDGSVLDAYEAATGVRPLPRLLELYRIRWDLADLAMAVSRFRREHKGTAEDDKSRLILRDLVDRISS